MTLYDYAEEKMFNSEDKGFINSNGHETNSEAELPIKCGILWSSFGYEGNPQCKTCDKLLIPN